VSFHESINLVIPAKVVLLPSCANSIAD
jgi:hypothetical protein